MVVSGEEIEGGGLKSTFGGGFAKASFAEENGLPTSSDGLADGGQFFKSVGHGRRTWETMRG